MALLGKGVLANWHNVPDDGHDEFNAWHTHEHIPERVGVPGFLRGRRYRALQGVPQYFILYETTDDAVLTAQPYLDRLNDPSPWTRKMGQTLTLTIRTAARVVMSQSSGVGGIAGAWRLAPAPGRAEPLRDWLTATAIPQTLERWGVTGAHLLEANEDASTVDTAEKKDRQQPDERADWILIIEGVDQAAVASACEALGSLADHGADGGDALTLYRLQTVMAESETS